MTQFWAFYHASESSTLTEFHLIYMDVSFFNTPSLFVVPSIELCAGTLWLCYTGHCDAVRVGLYMYDNKWYLLSLWCSAPLG